MTKIRVVIQTLSQTALAGVVFAALAFMASTAMGQEQTQDLDVSPLDSAPLIIDGDTLFYLAGSHSFPAAERVEHVENRIIQVAKDPGFDTQDIKAQAADRDRIDILAGTHRLVSIFPVDAAVEGIPVPEMVEVASARISSSIDLYRQRRTFEHLLRSAITAAIAVVVAGGFIWLVQVLFRKLFNFLEVRYKRRVQDLKIESFEIIRADNIWSALTGTLRFIRIALVLVTGYFCLELALYQFPWTRGTAQALFEMVITPLATISTAFLDYLPELLFLVILIAISRYLLKFMHMFFHGVEKGRVQLGGFEPEWAQPTYKLLRFFVILLTVVLAYPYIPGSGSAAFQGLSILLGIMVSLGASSAVSSVVAGYAMTYRKAFREGDLIRVGEHTGVVVDSRLLVTHLRTIRNEEIVLPNSMILTTPITNLSRPAEEDGLILHTTVGIGYETPWRQVEAMLKEAAARTRSLKTKPAPFVLEKALGDYAITYELNVYIDNPVHLPHRYAELHRNILDVFNEYGVAIMTPSYMADPDDPKLVPPENWYLAPARQPDTQNTPGKTD